MKYRPPFTVDKLGLSLINWSERWRIFDADDDFVAIFDDDNSGDIGPERTASIICEALNKNPELLK